MNQGISVLLIVHNEGTILDECLSKLNFADEIVIILDKCSDNSEQIAKKYTQNYYSGSWEIEGDRRNYGISMCNYKWILEIDADEIISSDLANEIKSKVMNENTVSNFHIKVDNYIGDKLVKFGWGSTFGRGGVTCLFIKGTKKWGPQRVHPQISFSGKMGPNLQNTIKHNFVENISGLFSKFNTWTHLKALDLIDSGQVHRESLLRNIRRVFTRFLKNYLKRKGYKEGSVGFLISFFAGSFPLISYLRAKIYLSGLSDK